MQSLGEVARQCFSAGFTENGAVRKEHRNESQTRLASGWLQSSQSWSELEALALSVRTVAQLEPKADAPITARQKQAWAALVAEPAVPPELKSVLEAATPKLVNRNDLHALYGILSGTMDKLITIHSVVELGDN